MRILVVDDERRLVSAVQSGLVAEGFDVDVAFDGLEGEWLARERDYAAVVLDIMLPGRDGIAVCRSLRATGVRKPILMLTARDGPRDIATALDAGADDYLAKPFALIVLAARLRALLRRAAQVRPAPLSVGDLVLDAASRRCTHRGQPVELTSREFSVLEYLVQRAGEVVSKLEILDNVWDFAFDGDPNIVEVYIARLRRKVDGPFGTHSILTVRGAGYRLAAGAG